MLQYYSNMLIVRALVWDAFNVSHIAEHGVSPEEVEQVCQGDHHVSQTPNGRLRLIGLTRGGHLLTIILAPKAEGTYYTVTARPASTKERQLYQDQEGGEAA
jgi:uncharacterized DUF497 family protein